MRYTDVSIRAIGGMLKVNTVALSTYLKIRNIFHYRKSQPAESHILVQSYNTGETASQVLENETAIPAQGNFSGTALHTDSSGAARGYFSDSPNGEIAYCNSVESMAWGGDEARCAGFINYDPGATFEYDFTNVITNTKDDLLNVATLKPTPAGIDANTMLLLSLNNNVTDTSPTTPHTVANNNVTFDATNKVFG